MKSDDVENHQKQCKPRFWIEIFMKKRKVHNEKLSSFCFGVSI